MLPTTDPVFQAYTVSALVLGANLLILANNTALTRAFSSEVVNPEDLRLSPAGTVVYEAGNDKTARYRRAHRNALENIPLFLVTAFLLALLDPPVALTIGLFSAFVAARLMHSVAYVRGLQPWRTLSFAAGAIVQVLILVVIGWSVFG